MLPRKNWLFIFASIQTYASALRGNRSLNAVTCATFNTNAYYQIINRKSGLPLALEGASKALGANIFQGTPGLEAYKNWKLIATSAGYYQIVSEHSGLAISVEGNDITQAGLNVVQADAVDGRQEWCITTQNGPGEIKNLLSNQALDATLSGENNVHQWWYWGGANQQWTLKYVKDIQGNSPTPAPVSDRIPAPVVAPTLAPKCQVLSTNGYFRIVNQLSGLPLGIQGASLASGANIYQGSDEPGGDKNWRFEATSGGFYSILSELSGLGVAVEGASQDLGANVIQHKIVGGEMQYDWCFVAQSGGYYEVRNRLSGHGLDATLSGGNNVLQWAYWGGANQQWSLEYVKDIGSGPPFSYDGKWIETESNASIDARHEACFVMVENQNKTKRVAVLVGGRGQRDTDIYDPVSRTWTKGARPPLPDWDNIHHMQCVSARGKLWIVSAWIRFYPNEENTDFVYAYDPWTNTWETKTPMPANRRRGSAAVVVVDNLIYVSHGNRGGHEQDGKDVAISVGWLDYYNIDTDTWTALVDKNAPYPRDHTGGALVGNSICVSGGRNGGEPGWPLVAETDCFNLLNNEWEVKADIPQPRAGSSYGQTCDGKLMVAGGEGNGKAWTNVDVFDGERWTSIDSLNIGRHGSGLAFNCVCNQIYIASGAAGEGGGPEITSVETYFSGGVDVPCSAS